MTGIDQLQPRIESTLAELKKYSTGYIAAITPDGKGGAIANAGQVVAAVDLIKTLAGIVADQQKRIEALEQRGGQ